MEATVDSLLSSLAGRGILLIPDGDGLLAKPREKLTDADRDIIRTHKAALLARLRAAQDRAAAEAPKPERNRWPDRPRPPMPLRRCGSLTCRACRTHSPFPHRANCAAPRLEPCRSRWFWLSPHGAIKCCACDPPADLSLAEAWVLAREGESQPIPPEILQMFGVKHSLQ